MAADTLPVRVEPPVRGARASFLRSLGRLLTASLDHPPRRLRPPSPRRQPYPDNHTDDTFLEHLVLNGRIVPRRLSRVVLDALTVPQQIAVVTPGVRRRASLRALVRACARPRGLRPPRALPPPHRLACGRAAPSARSFAPAPGRPRHRGARPLFRTMTEAISDDTAVASAVASLFPHLLTHDYAFLNDRTALPGGTVSHGAAMFASALISSRLENLDAGRRRPARRRPVHPLPREEDVRVVAGADAHVASRSPRTSPRSRRYGDPRRERAGGLRGGHRRRAAVDSPPVALVRVMRFKGKSTDHGTRPRSPPNNNKGSLVLFCTARDESLGVREERRARRLSERWTQQMRDSVLSHSYF